MNISCPYCNIQVIKGVCKKPPLLCSVDNHSYYCENHLPVEVKFWLYLDKIDVISLFYKNLDIPYILDIFHNTEIRIFKRYGKTLRSEYLTTIPIDKKLTPENLPNKLKTYLTFR
jgi:hypothetical protein